MNYIIAHDLPSNIPGKTIKEVNLEKNHNIPIGALVEIKSNGVRMFVVKHTRDCDGTPLYSLSPEIDAIKIENDNLYRYYIFHGYAEEDLILI